MHLEGEARSRYRSTTRLSRKYGDGTHFLSEIPFSLAWAPQAGHFPGLGPGCTFGVSRQGPSFAPYQLWGLPGIGAGTTAPIHRYDLAEAIHPLTRSCFITVEQVTSSCVSIQTESASDLNVSRSLGHVHVDAWTFNCSWSSQATKLFITPSSRLTPHLRLLSQLLQITIEDGRIFSIQSCGLTRFSTGKNPPIPDPRRLTLLTQLEF